MPTLQAGFTLIELLIVVALVGLIGLFVLPSIGNSFKISLGSTTRQMATTIKETYNSTAMTKKVHRMVYDLKENSFWVESGPMGFLLDTGESRAAEERRRRFAKPSDKPPPSGFSIDKTITKKAIPLPRGVTFEDIVTEQNKEPITEGVAYTHFFPHGLIEQTVIHLKDESKHQITLVIEPLIGRTRMIERYVKASEAIDL